MGCLIVKKAYYETPAGQVHYRHLYATIKDESKAPILFLHMTAISGQYYEPLMHRYLATHTNPQEDPASIAFYVKTFLLLAKEKGLSKRNLVGHHTGASLGTEWAALYPSQILSPTISGPALCTTTEQEAFKKNDLVMFNKPVVGGSHFTKTWEYSYKKGKWDKPEDLHPYCLKVMRACKGRSRAYNCVFSHDMIGSMELVKCPMLDLTSEEGMLRSYALRMKDIKTDYVVGKVGGGDWEPLKDVENFASEL
ncbi:uncharacterized protein PAC_13356 [Phialocephala subalpina]|uniref:AB hydrolase-1 domain-containing protein n=1 Tax=Phialocephala subalpina TaxID=576137 RepID=A0A1L7XEJ0_9HELO|nr:uncharacterized protein PAC_13356 [Phialocephala subalpina]